MLTINEIKNDETKNIEFKEAIPTDSKKYLKTVSAYSNSAGGKIIFGIEDETLRIVGIKEDIHKAIDRLTNIIADSITPQIIPNIYAERIEDVEVIILEVYHGSSTPYYITSLGLVKGTFVRTAGSTRPADSVMLKELQLAGLNRSFDELVYEPKELTKEEIAKTAKKLTAYAKETAIHPEDVKDLSLPKMLSWKFIHEVEGKYYPSNAYVLMQDDNPFQYMTIQCARFKGTHRDIFIDKKDYDGPLYQQIDNAYKFVLNHINMGLTINGLTNSKEFEIPPKAIREIICNAVAHRIILDHSRVQVAVFDDRVEITSPGGLFGGLTLEMMLHGRTATRNNCIVNVFHYLNLIENWGTGIERTLNLCEAAGIEKPEFIDMGSAIRVNFYRPSYNVNLVTDQDSDQDSDQVNDQDECEVNANEILEFCKVPRTLKEMMDYFNYKHRTYFVNVYIKPLLNSKKLGLTIPDKPNSRNQKYVRK